MREQIKIMAIRVITIKEDETMAMNKIMAIREDEDSGDLDLGIAAQILDNFKIIGEWTKEDGMRGINEMKIVTNKMTEDSKGTTGTSVAEAPEAEDAGDETGDIGLIAPYQS